MEENNKVDLLDGLAGLGNSLISMLGSQEHQEHWWDEKLLI
jgi:hypothetical protein